MKILTEPPERLTGRRLDCLQPCEIVDAVASTCSKGVDMLKAGLALALVAVAALAAGAASHGAFTGANGRIVFQRGGMYDGARSNLYLVNPNGGGVVRLTRGPQHDAQP